MAKYILIASALVIVVGMILAWRNRSRPDSTTARRSTAEGPHDGNGASGPSGPHSHTGDGD